MKHRSSEYYMAFLNIMKLADQQLDREEYLRLLQDVFDALASKRRAIVGNTTRELVSEKGT